MQQHQSFKTSQHQQYSFLSSSNNFAILIVGQPRSQTLIILLNHDRTYLKISKQSNESSIFTNSNSRAPCQICGKTSHQALDCFHRMDYSYQGRDRPTQLAAVVAQTNTAIEEQEWLADSGANAHIIDEVNNLTIQQPFANNETVAVGNGSNLTVDNSGSALSIPLNLNSSYTMFFTAQMPLPIYFLFKGFVLTMIASLF
jgi:hypothetical protein